MRVLNRVDHQTLPGIVAEMTREFPGQLPVRGRVWHVDAISGNNSNTGRDWTSPFLTMAKAFTSVDNGDVIRFKGKVREQLVTPVQVFDVTVIGEGNRPRHADSTPAGGDEAAATWAAPASPTATTALCRVLQQGWRFENILFAPHTDYGALEFVRNAGAGNAERDASHGVVRNCRFAAGAYHIMIGKAGEFSEIVNNLLIQGNTFNDATTTSLFSPNAYSQRLQVLDNVFQGNVNSIIVPATKSVIARNFMGSFTTKSIDLVGGGGLNIITLNYLSGTYDIASGYRGSNANDEWGGNMNSLAGGWTAADPA